MNRNCKLGDITELSTGPFGSQLHKSDYVDTGIPVVMPQNINNLRDVNHNGIAQIKNSDYQRLNRHALLEDDIVFARRGEVDKHAFISKSDLPMLCGTGCLRVRVKDRTVNPHYLSLYLNKPEVKARLRRHAVGSNMPNLNTGILAEIPISLPDKAEQDAIVNLLGAIDDKIRINQRICKELEKTVSLIYDYWFTQFDFPDENGNPYRSSGGALQYGSILKQMIPDGWSIGRISDFGSIVSGGTPDTSDAQNYQDKGIAWATPKDLANTPNNIFFTHGKRDISDRGLANSSAVLMPAGSILMTSRAPIGYLRISENTVCTNQGFKSIVPNEEFSSEFVYLTLKKMMPIIESSGAGTTFKEISKTEFENITIILPRKEILNKFKSKVNPFFALRSAYEKEISQLHCLRNWILPILMNGQIKISKSNLEHSA